MNPSRSSSADKGQGNIDRTMLGYGRATRASLEDGVLMKLSYSHRSVSGVNGDWTQKKCREIREYWILRAGMSESNKTGRDGEADEAE